MLAIGLLASCDRAPATHRLEGGTMGTTWHVTYTADVQPESVTEYVEHELKTVNDSMSTYRAGSEINRVNAADTGAPIAVSPPFADVLEAALAVGAQTAGAYDVTVGPLVDLWGFGAGSDAQWQVPSAEQVSDALSRVGQAALLWDAETASLTRTLPVSLDFSSLAKGYAVDRVAAALEAAGIMDYMVEIGGEIRVAGVSPRGDAWRIAVERPVAGSRGVAKALDLTDIALATSGDYRNFVELDGERYSHTIDPRSGYPVAHDMVSVTVLHERCMMADAWATALGVVGPDAAMRLATEHDLAVYLMRRDGDGVSGAASPQFTARFGASNE